MDFRLIRMENFWGFITGKIEEDKMRIGRFELTRHWKTKWVQPEYGLELADYPLGMTLWVDGYEAKIIKINQKRNRFKVALHWKK